MPIKAGCFREVDPIGGLLIATLSSEPGNKRRNQSAKVGALVANRHVNTATFVSLTHNSTGVGKSDTPVSGPGQLLMCKKNCLCVFLY